MYGVVLHAHPVRGESHNQRNTTGEVATAPAGSPNRGCVTRALPPAFWKGVATGALVSLHNSIIGNFMIYRDQDRIETNFLWFLL